MFCSWYPSKFYAWSYVRVQVEGREFGAASCSFGYTAVVLAVNKILFYFGRLPIILQQKQQLVKFFRETVYNPSQSNLVWMVLWT